MGTAMVEAGAAVAADRTEHAFGTVLASLINNDQRLGEMGRSARAMVASLSWEDTLRPLVEWAKDPKPAVDRKRPRSDGSNPLGRVGDRIKLHLDDGGAKQVLQRGFDAGKRRFGR